MFVNNFFFNSLEVYVQLFDLFVFSCMVDFVRLACSEYPEDCKKVRTCLGCWSDTCVSLLLTHVKQSYTILGALCSNKSLIVSFLVFFSHFIRGFLLRLLILFGPFLAFFLSFLN